MNVYRSMRKILVFTCFFGLAEHCIAQSGTYNCTGDSCGECTIKGPDCSWCRALNFGHDRCGTFTDLENRGCPADTIVRRKRSRVLRVEDKDLDDGGEGRESIQIQPQHIKIYLVPIFHDDVTIKGLLKELDDKPLIVKSEDDDQYNNFTIAYKVAKNFPLDLYVISDPSLSMQNFRKKLQELVDDLALEIKQTTTNYRFGLGTAMDKVASPFSYTTPERRQNPCYKVKNQTCAPGYSYRHHFSLSDNITGFKDALNEVKTSANIDVPEGLFDGLMQAMVCGDRIGWRQRARRMLLFATDSSFHMAGDGRLAGILPPNDGKCHLDENGFYTKAEITDYPSIPHLRKESQENNINIIFAIGGDFVSQAEIQRIRQRYYEKVAQTFSGASATDLTPQADNIVNIISENYKRLRETVILEIQNTKWRDSTRFFSKCYSDISNARNSCSKLTPEEPVFFDVILLTQTQTCPAIREETFSIVPQGLQDRIEVDVIWDCNCDCEKPENIEFSSPHCHGHGDLKCGICECHDGWEGELCDCDERLPPSEVCSFPGSNEVCSGIGCCVCGKCMCNMTDCELGLTTQRDYISGLFCECDSRKCKIPPGSDEPCGGDAQGTCVCDTCQCKENYYGEDCSCSDDFCSQNGTVCNGNGVCDCNECKCGNETLTGKFVGRFCETFRKASKTSVCSEQTDCVLCKLLGQGALSKEECDEKCTHVKFVDVIDPADVFCRIPTVDGCNVQVTFDAINGTVSVRRSKANCQPDVMLIGLSIAGAVIAVGILLLIIWKILTMLYDHVEYAMFTKEIDNPSWENELNPIYKDCVTTVQNPEYGGSKEVLNGENNFGGSKENIFAEKSLKQD